MKLKKYIENLNKFIKENPEVLEFEVIDSYDVRHKCCEKSNLNISLGNYDKAWDPFYDKDFVKLCEADDYDFKLNAICINQPK